MCNSTIGLGDTLELLRADHAEFLASFADGDYSLWIGSGISRRRLPGVAELMERLIRELHSRIHPSTHNCPYQQAIAEACDVIGYDFSSLDMGKDPDEWPLEELCARLADRYSEVLDIVVLDGAGHQDLIWDVLRLPEVYADPSVNPDAEHYFVALLVEERVLGQLLTTNWDPLIERAHSEIAGPNSAALSTIASVDELQQGRGDTLFKVHGCAAKALEDRALYGPFLVASERQITGWGEDAHSRPLREEAQSLLRGTNALFIGLSGHDSNLRRVVDAAAEGRSEEYLSRPPKLAFTAEAVDYRRRSILRRVYSDYLDRAGEIDTGSCIPPCAKPLLGGLYIDIVVQKLRMIASSAEDDLAFPAAFQPFVEELCDEVEDRLTAFVDGQTDTEERWCRLAETLPHTSSHVVKLFRDCSWLDTEKQYVPLLPGAIRTLRRADGQWSPLRLHWFLLALAIVWRGEADGYWEVSCGRPSGADVEGASLILERSDGRIGLVIADQDDTAKIHLERNGIVAPGRVEHWAVLYPRGSQPPGERRKSLLRSLPTSFVDLPKEIWLQDLAAGAGDPGDLGVALRDELLLTTGTA